MYVNGELVTSTTNTYYISPGFDKQEIYIVAVGDGVNYSNSPRSSKVVCEGKEQDVVKQAVFMNTVLEDGAWDYSGDLDYALRFVEATQSKDEALLTRFTQAFSENLDNDGGYRGEFWGKTVRGAVFAYRYTLDEELYGILERSVKLMLADQEEDGRLESKDRDGNKGWGYWGRHYAITGMLHFYSVCKDETLKQELLDGCKALVDFTMQEIIDKNIDILTYSNDWGGLPSTRFLQSVLAVYCLCEEQKYLDFAEEIIATGGCTMKSPEGRTIVEDCLLKTPIYKWGCRKLYEVTNFFDGILVHYILTGDETSRQLSENYFELVAATEITATGGLATEVEEANNAVVEQADPDNLGRMLENCVMGTWAMYCMKIYQTFDRIEAVEYMEKAYYNMIMGTVDYDAHNGLPFFSYSPCGCTARTNIYSGGAYVKDTFYSCCVAMGNAALGQVPLMSVMKNDAGLTVNMYFSGTVSATTPAGNKVSLVNETTLPKQGTAQIRLNMEKSESFTIRFRIPQWSKNTVLKLNGVALTAAQPGSYYSITRQWNNGDTVDLSFDMTTTVTYGSAECSNPKAQYNVVIQRGPVVFARDRRIEGDSIFDPVQFDDNNGVLEAEVVETVGFSTQVELKVKTRNGYIHLVDYGSAGKTQNDESIMCLWIPTKDYWSADLSKMVVVRCFANGSPNAWNGDCLISSMNYKDTTNKAILAQFAWKFVPVEGTNAYRIQDVNSGMYLTVHANGYTLTRTAEMLDDDSQLFYLHKVGLNRYKISGKYDKLITVHDQTWETYMFNDISHELQYWYVENVD